LFSKSHSVALSVTASSGFHLRPVAQFVAKAKTFDAQIHATFKDKTVNANAVNTLLSLNLEENDTFLLSAKGHDAQVALESLTLLFTTLMKTDKQDTLIEKKECTFEASVLEGDIICDGLGIAPLHLHVAKETFSASDVGFDEALSLALAQLENLYESHKSQSNAGIYLAQKVLLEDLSTQSQTLGSLVYHINQESQALKGGKMEAKIVDYQDILHRVKSHLGYDYSLNLPSDDFIYIADDLLPSDIKTLEASHAQGVILKKSSLTSHTAILLRASGLPSLILNKEIEIHKGNVILDATAGVLILHPEPSDLIKAKASKDLWDTQKKKCDAKRHECAYTKTDKRILVFANVTDVASAVLAEEEGAEGIGLLRTEFLFNQVKPSFKVQKNAYESIFSLFTDVTVRTLDVGGDKALPYVDIPKEDNPFLGIRGVRLFRTHPHLIEEQLHAIFAASKGKTIKLMFPMVSAVSEFIDAKAFALDVAKKYKIDISNVLFGIMVEVPSVLFLIKEFNDVVDFYSIGTNDLTQYLFATERTHPLLKTDTLSPVVFSALKSVVSQATKPVSICGELASDKNAIEKLIHLGLETFSVTPKLIAQTKESIRNV
jgi:phosphocarrier protein FPr